MHPNVKSNRAKIRRCDGNNFQSHSAEIIMSLWWGIYARDSRPQGLLYNFIDASTH